uniref:Uncharacterized protein n=1 Tax=Macaca fascicularis TaxID=9541 RepID=A0A7N9IEZ8_MACFA
MPPPRPRPPRGGSQTLSKKQRQQEEGSGDSPFSWGNDWVVDGRCLPEYPAPLPVGLLSKKICNLKENPALTPKKDNLSGRTAADRRWRAERPSLASWHKPALSSMHLARPSELGQEADGVHLAGEGAGPSGQPS